MRERRNWVGVISFAALMAGGCASLPLSLPLASHSGSETTESEQIVPLASDVEIDEEFTELVATLRKDLTAARSRDRERLAVYTPPTQQKGRSSAAPAFPTADAFSRRTISNYSLIMPVLGVEPNDLRDTWGASRDGGRRRHRGIDIFAPRGTAVVAVADGFVSYVGEQPKGGRCLWLATEEGLSFYYAHLDRWASGLYEGMEVKAGQILGYVGNTGNARSTPSHLHLAVHDDEDAVNPFPLLKYGVVSRGVLQGGFTRATR
jgi:murein DD-endopeptidase MepM/ murein hydrolase activator NlpD